MATKPFRYYGGKARIAHQLIAMMPTHKRYIEPFLGSGAVIFTKPPLRHELVNDIDNRLVTFFRVLRDQPDELIEACRLTPYARAELSWCKHNPNPNPAGDVETARRFYVTVTQSFAATTSTSTGWSASMKKNVNRARSTQYAIDRFHHFADRFRNVQIESRPAHEVITTYAPGLNQQTLIYCDPPYVLDTRSNSTRGHGYAHEMTDTDHHQLAHTLHNTGATVMISGYPSPLYDQDLYPDWHRYQLPTTTTVGQTQPHNRNRTEVIWANQPLNHQPTLPFNLPGDHQ